MSKNLCCTNLESQCPHKSPPRSCFGVLLYPNDIKRLDQANGSLKIVQQPPTFIQNKTENIEIWGHGNLPSLYTRVLRVISWDNPDGSKNLGEFVQVGIAEKST